MYVCMYVCMELFYLTCNGDPDGEAGTSLQMSYIDIAKSIIRDEGWQGLFGRGLQVHISIHTYMHPRRVYIHIHTL